MGLGRYRMHTDSSDYFKDIFYYYQSFGLFIEQINAFIENDVVSQKEIYEKYRAEYKDQDLFEQWNYEIELKSTENLVDIYYDAFLISMYSFTEKKMFILSNYLSSNHQVKVQDLAGSGIFKYRLYLSKVCGIDFAPIEKDWQILLNYNTLRNHLVHAEGNRSLPKNKQPLLQFLKNTHGVMLTDLGEYVSLHFSEDSILYDFLNCSQRIVEYLYTEKQQTK